MDNQQSIVNKKSQNKLRRSRKEEDYYFVDGKKPRAT